MNASSHAFDVSSELQPIAILNKSHIKNNSLLVKNYQANSSTDMDLETATLVFGVVVSCIGLLSNSTVIISCWQKKQKTTFFIISLACADILNVFLLIGYTIYMSDSTFQTELNHILLTSCHVFLCCASQLHNVVISVERCIAITAPVQHRWLINGRRKKWTIAINWITSAMLAMNNILSSFFGDPKFQTVVFWTLIFFAFVVPLVLITICYSLIAVAGYLSLNNHNVTCQLAILKKNNTAKELKLLFNTSIMVLPMMTCWSIFFGGTIYEKLTDTYLSGQMNWILTFLPFLASALDPIIYTMNTRSLSKVFTKHIRTTLKKSIAKETLV